MHRHAKKAWRIFTWVGFAILGFWPITARAVLPIQGMPVPELVVFDELMSE